jgi:hypothetical protein
MHHKGKVVSRTELIEHIYDQDFDRDSNTIEVFVTRIRKKLAPTSSPPAAGLAIAGRAARLKRFSLWSATGCEKLTMDRLPGKRSARAERLFRREPEP